jgi:hypothetical protein
VDKLTNPFSPGAGATPPVLVGRDQFLEDYTILLNRLRLGYTDKSLLVTGLRGVGKTVLLNRFESIATEQEWIPAWAEIAPEFEFAERTYTIVRQALFSLSKKELWSDRFKRAARVLKSFHLTIHPDGSLSGGIEAPAEEGVADSGFLDQDLTDLFLALGEAALEKKRGVVFLFDEIQFLTTTQLASLVVALHRTTQRRLPITLVAAGLPQLPELVGEAKSYAERLFNLLEVDRLDKQDVAKALTEPADNALKLTGGALDLVYTQTDGHPYFVQEYGRALWNLTPNGRIDSTHVAQASGQVAKELDSAFFKVRTDRVSPGQLRVLRAMAESGAGPVPIERLEELLHLDQSVLGELLGELCRHAIVYSPRFGLYAFTVPHYDNYLRRRFSFADGQVVRTA